MTATLERSPAGHVTAQAAIVDAQKHFGPVDGDVCLRGRKALLRWVFGLIGPSQDDDVVAVGVAVAVAAVG
jgi:hypothetical protein